MLKRMGESRHPVRLQLFSEPVSYAAFEEDCTGGIVTEVFDDLPTKLHEKPCWRLS